MKTMKTSLLVGTAALALTLTACAGTGGSPDPVGQGTGAANSAGPNNEPATAPTEITVEAPTGGAAVRLGDTEEAIDTVGCTEINGTWAVSGSNEGGAKAAVTTSGDRQTVVTASVVLADGKLVDVKEGQGTATITWNGETFTVTGTGPYLDLMSGETASTQEIGFMLTGSCPS